MSSSPSQDWVELDTRQRDNISAPTFTICKRQIPSIPEEDKKDCKKSTLYTQKTPDVSGNTTDSDSSSDENNLDNSTESVIDSLHKEINELLEENQKLRISNQYLIDLQNKKRHVQGWGTFLKRTFQSARLRNILLSLIVFHTFRTLTKEDNPNHNP